MGFKADQICYSVLCVFSYIAAGQEQRKVTQHKNVSGSQKHHHHHQHQQHKEQQHQQQSGQQHQKSKQSSQSAINSGKLILILFPASGCVRTKDGSQKKLTAPNDTLSAADDG